jgi:hypothetical protein
MAWQDGVQAIRNASVAEHNALAEYRNALRELRDYLNGVEAKGQPLNEPATEP